MSLCLVTGGTGFIGSNLCERLVARGERVRILRRRGSDLRAIAGIDVEHRIGDLLDPDSVRDAVAGCDMVFHTAALVSFRKTRRAEQFEVNVRGTRNVVQACISAGVPRVAHVSSIAAIGHTDDGTAATEENAYNWGTVSAYRHTKHLAEQEVLSGVARGLSAVIVNPSVVIGERDMHFHGGEILRSVKRGIVFLYPEGGMNVAYVGDVVEGMIAAARQGQTGGRYILGGWNLTYREVFTRTAQLIGGRAPFARLPTPFLLTSARIIEKVCEAISVHPPLTEEMVAGTTRNNRYSSDKAVRELGYRITPFDHAVMAAYRWYNERAML